jgi:DnaK suppressor protein
MPKKPTVQDLREFKDLLTRLRREVRGDITDLERDAFTTDGEKASVDNPADIGTENFSQEFNLELLQRDEATLGEIEEALERVANGKFGQCEACEGWIPKERLRALPYARNCVKCQRVAEENGR